MSSSGDTKEERRILSLSSKSALMRMSFAFPAILSSYKIKLPRSVDVIPEDDAVPTQDGPQSKSRIPHLITSFPLKWKSLAGMRYYM